MDLDSRHRVVAIYKENEDVQAIFLQTRDGEDYFILAVPAGTNFDSTVRLSHMYWELRDQFPEYSFDFRTVPDVCIPQDGYPGATRVD